MSRRSSMQRPVMDPLFLQDLPAGRPDRLRRWLAIAGRASLWLGRRLVSRPLSFERLRSSPRHESRGSRFIRGFAYRLLFAPVALALVACLLVYTATHPRVAAASGDPSSFGVYFDSVDFLAADGTSVNGWLVPVVDARRVLLHKERLLHQKYAAVVLVHDHGQLQQQMLPLITPLHEDGFVVLAVNLRGTGTGRPSPQTFGLTESADVLGAVQMLRDRPYIDASRIAVVGLGSGATAALLAVKKDPSIKALVLADPVVAANDVVAKRLGPDVFGLRWMQPMTKWAFEIRYHQDLDEVNLSRHTSTLASLKVLRVDHATQEDRLMAAATEQIRAFCRETLRPWE